MAKPTTFGAAQIAEELRALGSLSQGKVIRGAALQATTPAVRAARARAPVGNPPFESGKDPYPVRSYSGILRTPGYAKRNIARKTVLKPGDMGVDVLIGVKPEAFYAVQFIELGTSTIPKRPWLEPALRESIPEMEQRFFERLRLLAAREVGKAR